MNPDEIREKGLFPQGFLPLPHVKHASGGQVFPRMEIDEIRKLIRRLAAEEGRTVILSTHIMGEVEAICQRVLLIAFGQLRLDARLDDLRQQGSLEEVFVREVEIAAATRAEAPAADVAAASVEVST